MTQVAAEMAWEERLDNAEKVRQAVTINHITSLVNKSNIESSSANNPNIEATFANKSNVESSPVNKLNAELNSELDGPNTPGHSEILCNSVDGDNENENEETEELNTVSTDLYNHHPAEHKDSKIKLQCLFVRELSQPSFVRILQQYIEDNPNTR
ncbi:18030_t:CDS:2, partial [Racocetra fulgida]